MHRILDAKRISTKRAYTILEIVELLEVSKHTVRSWIRRFGLMAIPGRPVLIAGNVLKAFLANKRAMKRQPCGPRQAYCVRCRVPRDCIEAIPDVYVHHNGSQCVAVVTCSHCGTKMNRFGRLSHVDRIAQHFKSDGVRLLNRCKCKVCTSGYQQSAE